EHTVVPDRIEAATYLAAVAVAGGEVTLAGAVPDHMTMLVQKLGEMGVRCSPDGAGLWVMPRSRLAWVDVSTLPYPGLATDYKPLFVVMLSVADGVGIVTENLFAGRFRYVDELTRMGGGIGTGSPPAGGRLTGGGPATPPERPPPVGRGVPRPPGPPVRAPDIRAGAALAVAGLA